MSKKLPSRSSAAPPNWSPKVFANEGYILWGTCECGDTVVFPSTYTDGLWHHGKVVEDDPKHPIIVTDNKPECPLYILKASKFGMVKDVSHPKWDKDLHLEERGK